jgi:hypothetical protein
MREGCLLGRRLDFGRVQDRHLREAGEVRGADPFLQRPGLGHRKSDAHGMAIKLLGVPGDKLVPGHEHESAVDFVLVDSEVFFTGDLPEYLFFTARFLKSKSDLLYTTYF